MNLIKCVNSQINDYYACSNAASQENLGINVELVHVMEIIITGAMKILEYNGNI